MNVCMSRFGYFMLLPLVAGCASLPKPYTASCEASPKPEITISPDGKTARTTLDVLTYNIEGLPWPARKGRPPFLQKIGEALAELRANGAAPDIVMFQEMFSRAAVKGVVTTGYPSLAVGPTRTQSRKTPSTRSHRLAPAGKAHGRRQLPRVHFLSSGLAIASEYPILHQASDPFSQYACAGFDCFSNKGTLFARVALPGLPEPIDLFTTHMNSAGKRSKISLEEGNSVHAVQTVELKDFANAVSDVRYPLLVAGDFNTRDNIERFEFMRPKQGVSLVHEYCLEQENACDVQMSWDGDEPWMDTQDLQFFWDGDRVTVRPLAVEAMFDGKPDSPVLSDHDGFRVLYELSWSAEDTRPSNECWTPSSLQLN